jgi:hypothetical protein
MNNITNVEPVAQYKKLLPLTAYNTTRIVYQVIKLYMLTNTPEQAGIKLAQTFNADPVKSQIKLEMAWNWKTQDMSKVPAVYIQREDVAYTYPTLGQKRAMTKGNQIEERFALATMPITITCVAAEPLAVVENLAEYVKQPLLYFRREVQDDFGIRRFELKGVSKAKLVQEGKNNFNIDLNLEVVFDENWKVDKDAIKIKHIGIQLFDELDDAVLSVLV